jgi:aspartyl protease family protein
VVSAAASAQVVLQLAQARDRAEARHVEIIQAPAPVPAAPATGEEASIVKAADGHFWAEASVNGHEVRFLVDTGASAVALTPTDAERLGIDPTTLNYAFTVTTASGQAKAAAVDLTNVTIGAASVDNVRAYVIQTGLQNSLLGMTYLGRLSQFDATQNQMILRP